MDTLEKVGDRILIARDSKVAFECHECVFKGKRECAYANCLPELRDDRRDVYFVEVVDGVPIIALTNTLYQTQHSAICS